ncbi:TetR/AcrR family transcriptional regulator [Trujillonella endophytica]|uniref:Transcriptional regulator, TetR family n=1 Tax=Trujillonella endophytica TaxID=673521 RepID=A0A1H8VXP9_9ACTN|nr:TetR/AcrR family transcriptional regulator [Trujillella endophytica]SEP20179.1 transcriptional regulator, TetR family [Trujillella endophytica]
MATPLPDGASGDVPRPDRRPRIEASRDEVLDTAEELFGARGYRGTSLQQVAQRCGFSVGAVYLFFTNKEDLFAEVLRRRGGRLAELTSACAERAGPAIDVLVDWVDVVIGFHRQHPGFGQLSARMVAPGGAEEFPRQLGVFAERRDEALAPVVELIARGQRQGSIRAGDPLVLVRLLSALVTAHHGMDPTLLGTSVVVDDDEFRAFVRDSFAAPR